MHRKPGLPSVLLLIGSSSLPGFCTSPRYPVRSPVRATRLATCASAAAHPAAVRSTPRADRALSRRAPRPDHNRLHQSTGDSRRHQLAREEPEPQGRRAHRRRAKAGVRSRLPRSRHLPNCASNDVRQHRRLRRHRTGHVRQPGRGGRFHPAPAQPGLRLRSAPHQPTADRSRSSRSPISPSTSFSLPIRRSSTSPNTTPPSSTSRPAPAPSSQPRSSPSE